MKQFNYIIRINGFEAEVLAMIWIKKTFGRAVLGVSYTVTGSRLIDLV